MFELIEKTAGFNVKFRKPYTVGDFINDILSTRTTEWGYVNVIKIDGHPIFCGYRYGELFTEPFSIDILSKKIKKIIADGGWVRMDYTVTLK